jgi:ABC-2 type transport system permease protein
MNKIWLIIQREYLIRVRKKTFLVTTFLIPLLFVALMLLPVLAARFAEEESYLIYVHDPTGSVFPQLVGDSKVSFAETDLPLDKVRPTLLAADDNVGYLFLPSEYRRQQTNAVLYTPKAISRQVDRKLYDQLQNAIRNLKMEQAGISTEALDDLRVELSLENQKVTESGTEEVNVALATVLSFALGFTIYFMVVTYGNTVMKGVMEEKVNRIVEVMVSSVRPIQLMFGKIIGIGAVGLTQVLLWIALGLGLIFLAGVTGLLGDPAAAQATVSVEEQQQAQEMATKIQQAIQQFRPGLLGLFVLYFVGGYLLYGSLLAAIGASVDQENEGQELSIFAWIPLIIPIVFLTAIIENPNGSMAFWGSMVPFFSPILMLARVAAADVPTWQVLLSLGLLFGGVAGMAWLAARIYRVGIFLYGKKPKPLELLRWAFRNG